MLKNKEEFLELFVGIKNEKDIVEKGIFFDPIFLRDCEFGFSIKINYPEEIKYKPLRAKNGKVDELCLIHLMYFRDRKPSKNGIPILIKCHKFSKYLAKEEHVDYNFEDKDCPTKESIEASKKTAKYAPRDYISDDFAFFNLNSNRLVNSKGGDYIGKNLLTDVFNYHIKKSKKIAGIPLRFKIKAKNILIFILGLIEKNLKCCLKSFFGRSLRPENPIQADLVKGYEKQDMVLHNIDSLSIFGYQASKRVIMTFCFLMFSFYLLFSTLNYRPLFIVRIVKNSFLSLIASISILGILDTVVPNVILIFLNCIIKLKSRIRFGKDFI